MAAFVAPVYGTDSSSSSGQTSQGSDTLVGVNGLSAAVVLAVPLLVTLAVGCALWLGTHRGALPVAWTLVESGRALVPGSEPIDHGLGHSTM